MHLSQAASLALRLKQGQDVTCMGEYMKGVKPNLWIHPALYHVAFPLREIIPVRTLTDGPLHVAHNQAVLVVQELHADLGDLQGDSRIF